MTRRLWLVAVASLSVACAPELEDRPYLVERQQLIAVLAEPAELRPGAELRLTPVVASRGRASGSLAYHFCNEAPPPADPRPISEACLDDAGEPLNVEGTTARVPRDACARFGPDPIGSHFRPRDADGTGGFYQPLVVEGSRQASVALVRIICPLPDVALDLARRYGESYVANNNPRGLRLERESNGSWRSFDSAVPGEQVELRVAWDDAARERYVWIAPGATELQERVEAFEVAWFVTGGAVSEATTGRSEADPGNDSSNTFTAPEHAGTVQIGAVVHDSRGGRAVVRQTLELSE